MCSAAGRHNLYTKYEYFNTGGNYTKHSTLQALAVINMPHLVYNDKDVLYIESSGRIPGSKYDRISGIDVRWNYQMEYQSSGN